MNNIRFLTYSLLEVSYYFIVRKIGLYQPSVTYLPLALADLGSSGIHTFLWYFPLFSLLFDQLRLWLRKYVPAIETHYTMYKNSQKKSHSTLRLHFCRQKLVKNAKTGSYWRIFENPKLAVRQCYQTWYKKNWKLMNGM